MNIGDKASGRKNCFDFLRFIAASMVIFGHSYPILGIDKKVFPYGTIAVSIFFLISGFLISASYIHSKSLFIYLRNRFLRLYPALAVVVLISFFIIGPIFSSVSPKEYFSMPDTWQYLWNIIIFKFKSTIPTVFSNNVYPDIFNGSLWTLRTELHCYLIVAGAGLLCLFKKRQIPVLLSLVPCLIWGLGFSKSSELYFIALFLIGMFFYLYKDKIVLNKYIFITCFVLLLVYLNAESLPVFVHNIMLLLSLPYLVFYAAYNIPVADNFSKYGDFSYGLYIYAFPIQQILSYFSGGKMNFAVFFVSAFALTLICSILSWHVIEKRALALKKL